MLLTTIVDSVSFIKHLLCARGWGHNSEHNGCGGRAAVWRLLGGGDLGSRPKPELPDSLSRQVPPGPAPQAPPRAACAPSSRPSSRS